MFSKTSKMTQFLGSVSFAVFLGCLMGCKSDPVNEKILEQYRMKRIYLLLVEYASLNENRLPQNLADLSSLDGFSDELLRSGKSGEGPPWIYPFEMKILEVDSKTVILSNAPLDSSRPSLQLRSDGSINELE